MNVSLFQVFVAALMIGVAFVLFIAFRNYSAAASQRRMTSMLLRYGLDPATISRGDSAVIMKKIRQQCRTCTSEDLCERWLAGEVNDGNVFCPNARIFEAIQKTGHTTG